MNLRGKEINWTNAITVVRHLHTLWESGVDEGGGEMSRKIKDR